MTSRRGVDARPPVAVGRVASEGTDQGSGARHAPQVYPPSDLADEGDELDLPEDLVYFY